jgi:glycosyltransferase involved in cell wall biosynthesis
MRILFIGPNLGAGGAERQWSILLPGLQQRGADVALVALDAGGPFEEPLRRSGIPVDVVSMRNQADLPRLACSRLLRTFVPDVVVTRGVSGLYVGWVIARWRRASHVYNDHRQVGMALSRRRELMTSVVARRVDRVISVSAEQSGSWRSRGYPAERILVVANGVNTPQSAQSKSELRHELGIAASSVVALEVARLRREKRVPDFVQAVKLTRRSHPNVVGLIAGDGPERPAVAASIANDPGIRLLGHQDDVARLLLAADVFVLTSEYEALPMAILEAMAAGLPIISTRVGSIPRVIAEGETGRLVAPGDIDALAAALGDLAADPGARESMGNAAAQSHRGHWQADAMIEAYADVFAELVGTRGSDDSPGSTSAATPVPGATNRKL